MDFQEVENTGIDQIQIFDSFPFNLNSRRVSE
jgi:hypothetical protein